MNISWLLMLLIWLMMELIFTTPVYFDHYSEPICYILWTKITSTLVYEMYKYGDNWWWLILCTNHNVVPLIYHCYSWLIWTGTTHEWLWRYIRLHEIHWLIDAFIMVNILEIDDTVDKCSQLISDDLIFTTSPWDI